MPDLSHLSLPLLLLVFTVVAAVVWSAGIYLSSTTGALDGIALQTVVLVLYALGVAGLFAISGTH